MVFYLLLLLFFYVFHRFWFCNLSACFSWTRGKFHCRKNTQIQQNCHIHTRTTGMSRGSVPISDTCFCIDASLGLKHKSHVNTEVKQLHLKSLWRQRPLLDTAVSNPPFRRRPIFRSHSRSGLHFSKAGFAATLSTRFTPGIVLQVSEEASQPPLILPSLLCSRMEALRRCMAVGAEVERKRESDGVRRFPRD